MADSVGDTAGSLAKSSGKFLTNKVGPLPLWVYFGVVIVTVVGVRLYKSHQQGTSSGDDSTASPDDSQSSVTDDVQTPWYGSGVGSSAGQNTTGDTGDSGEGPTNSEWRVQAINAVQAQYGALAASNAINGWLAGTALAPEQVAIVNAAVAKVGAPPEGAPAQPTTQAPVVVPNRNKTSKISLVPTSIPTKLGQRMSVQVLWVDSNGVGINGNLQMQQSTDNKTWRNVFLVGCPKGIGAVSRPINATKHGYWRATVPITNVTYATGTYSNVVSWNIK